MVKTVISKYKQMRVIKESNRFDNEQMLLHFGDILDKFKIDKDLFINVEFHGKSIIIDSSTNGNC
jgi:hypothetical protein